MTAAQEFSIPIFFLVGRNLTEQARDAVSDVLAGGVAIKAVLEGTQLQGTSNFVPEAKVETVAVGGIEYLSATFTVDVVAATGIRLKEIMDTLAARLKGANYRNVSAFPVGTVETPAVIVGYPTNIDLQVTFG